MSNYIFLLTKLRGREALNVFLEDLQITLNVALESLSSDMKSIPLEFSVETSTLLEELLTAFFQENSEIPTVPVKFYPVNPLGSMVNAKSLASCFLGSITGVEYELSVVVLNETRIIACFWPQPKKIKEIHNE